MAKKVISLLSGWKFPKFFENPTSGKPSFVDWKSFWDKLVDFIAYSNLLSRSTMFGQGLSLHPLRRGEGLLRLSESRL